MKRPLLPCLAAFSLFIFLTSLSGLLYSQQTETSLPHAMTPEEMLRSGDIGKAFVETPPPPGAIRSVAEFDRMEGVLVRSPFGISYAIIAEMSEDTKVWTIVSGNSAMNTVINNYTGNGVNLANCRFIIAGSDSYWTRDYGPWFLQYTDTAGVWKTGVLDFPYNRPRPLDDEIPKIVADSLNLEWFGMNVIHTGGNYMTTGNGISSSTQIVHTENPTQTPAQLAQKFQDYLAVDTYHVVQDPNGSYINHIDCWGKFLAPDKVLIRSVPATHAQFTAIENTATYFANALSTYGTPFKVYRVFTPNNQPYTNSLILNNKVFVPVMNQILTDTAALHVYELAMPGYEVLGFTGSWQSTDALHCRAIGLADRGMLTIEHIPVLTNQPVYTPVTIDAIVRPMSGMGVYPDSVILYYKTPATSYTALPMTSLGNFNYTVDIPGMPLTSIVDYYIYASDSTGRRAMHPIMGPADPHQFSVGNVSVAASPETLKGKVQLHSCSPNPFSSLTLIDFSILQMSTVSLEIYNANGQIVRTLLSQPLGPGLYSIAWDGRDDNTNRMAGGIYVCLLKAGNARATEKLLLID